MDPEAIIRDPRNATHLEQRQAALAILAELDAARARIAELESELEALRAELAELTEDSYGGVTWGSAAPTRKD